MQTNVEERFSQVTDEVPNFRKHVVPLLTHLGCNAASCHGAKEGQAGFHLSLFGYDLENDIAELADEGDPPRANWKDPLDSAVLLKPTLEIYHEGGQRYEKGGWEYRLLLNWIKGRAPGNSHGEQWVELERIEIEPTEIVFARDGQSVALRAVAYWNDGTVEDVTPLCRFQSNDDAVAEVSPEGVVTRARLGDTHVVVFYDEAIASVPVLVPNTSVPIASDTASPPQTNVDRFIETKLRKLHIQPSAVCTDSEFLRRVSVDLTGTIPTEQEVRRFLADDNPDKRSRLIERLLDTDEYATWWTTFLCDVTGNNENEMPERGFWRQQSQQWYDWLHQRVRTNMPYDKIVEGMICGESRPPATSYEDYCVEMTAYASGDESVRFEDRDSLPHFWARRNVRSSVNKTLAFSHAFLGVRIQCAQCHKHPFDRWTKDDFDGLEAFFEPLHYGIAPDERRIDREFRSSYVPPGTRNARVYLNRLAKQGHVVPWPEVYYGDDGSRRQRSQSVFLRGASARGESNPLGILMEWMRGLDHPYLAIAFVNRVWAHDFGVGIVDPPDDLNLANPPSNRPLLDYLATGFVESGYDMKWLHREIVSSEAYQRTWRTNSSNQEDRHNVSHAKLRRFPAEVLYDAVWVATAADQSRAVKSARRTIGSSSGMMRSEGRNELLVSLGKPSRTAVCENERSNDPSLTQAFFVQNDPVIQSMLSRSDGWIANTVRRLAASGSELDSENQSALVDEAYLRTLNRFPTQEEKDLCRQFLDRASSPNAGLTGIVWALLNTKEFCINR